MCIFVRVYMCTIVCALWVLGIEFRASGLAISAYTPRAILPHPSLYTFNNDV